MTIGKLARKILGKKFNFIGSKYRSFFIDINKFANSLPVFEKDSTILDIGGGDGEVLDKILSKNPSMNAVLIDLAKDIGSMISNENKDKVKLFPSLSISSYIKTSYYKKSKYIIVSDVLHHIPQNQRSSFFHDLSFLFDKDTILIIKEVEKGYFKSIMALLADKYISGDKNVTFLSRTELLKLIKKEWVQATVFETNLLKINPPNYCFIISSLKN